MVLHLAQHPEPSNLRDDDESLFTLFLINEQLIDIIDYPWYKYLIFYLQNQKCPKYLDTFPQK